MSSGENQSLEKMSSINVIKDNLKNPSGFNIKFSLRLKLVLSFVALIVTAVLALGSIAIESEKEVIKKKITDSCFEISDVVSHEMGQLFENANRLLLSTAKIPAVRDFDTDTIKTIFVSLLSNFKIFTRMAIIDITGKEVYATLHDSSQRTSQILYSLVLKGNYDAYHQSEVYFVDNNIPTLTMAILMRNNAFSVSGMLIADLDLRIFRPIIDRIQLGKTGIFYILDQDGFCVAHSRNKELIGQKLEKSDEIIKRISGAGKDDLKAILNPERSDEPKLYAASSLIKFKPATNFSNFFYPAMYVVFEQDKSEAFLEAELLQKKVIYFMLVCLIIALIFSLILAWNFTRPISHLVDDANRISDGDLETEVRVSSNDEIGELAHNFDLMRQHLAYKVWELETINEIGRKISSVLNLDDLLKLILAKYIQTVGADRSSVMLFDEETGKLTTNIAKLTASDLETYDVDTNNGLGGSVYQSGRPVLIKDAQNSDELKKYKKGDIYPGSLMSVPLIVKERIIGVVNVSKSVANYFVERDFNLFNALALQCAIAIDNAVLYKLAITDGLTKLYLHRYFQQRLSNEMSLSDRYGYKFSLIITDIDHFKKFNDNYGHQVGDHVLREVARIVQQSVREVDIVARYGGEEFAVICPQKSNEDTIIPAERIRKAMESYNFMVNGERVPITISLGMSEYPTDAREKKDLIECADVALYSSKQNGRNRFTRYSDIPPDKRNIKDMKH